MANISEDIYCLLIPLENDKLVVPRTCVAEVIRYATPESGEEADSWFRGRVSWNNLAIPVVSLERLCDMSAPEPAGRTRIVVFNPVSPNTGPYGLLAEGFPQMVRVSREVLETDRSYRPEASHPLINRLQMLHEQAIVPDLEAIESRLREHTEAATAS